MSRIVTGTVVRALPRLGPVWDEVEGVISGPLHRLVAGTRAGEAGVLPTGTLTAWWRLSAAVRVEQERSPRPDGPCPDLCLVVVRRADVDVLGRGARRLGGALLPGAVDVAAEVRRRLVDSGTSHQRLVLDLACLHGLLDMDHGKDGELLHLLAGVRTRATGVLAARERVTGRVARMWSAAADPSA